jgi:uncharacterized membrane protein YqjE
MVLTSSTASHLIIVPSSNSNFIHVFAFTVEQFGLVLATILVTILGGLASPQTRFREAVIAAIVLAAIACVIFVWTIGLPIAVWPEI